ncbi:hypothetical protein [Actinokineospora fastidiosa]|uniref:Uncharacterized protein n=1 Tax=Actinokineospora fastidiosa TaxID=1816 RepID=A0A918GIC1_9PSEU|nr:hypothetical protein [Actinokineospora fastidiosa]GGS37975.1 hypothetical protein GCM10010171_36090 [Actinokineospora fastidiosa]
MTQPYGQQPGDQQYPQAPGYPTTPPGGVPPYGSMPAAPPEHAPPTRPGTIMTAAVLGYVQAGITLITSIILIAGLGAASDADGGVVLGVLVVLAQLAGCVLLILGGVKLAGGVTRTPYLIGAGLELAICLYYLISILAVDDGGFEFVEDMKALATIFPLFFAIMPAIGLAMALGGSGAQWLASRNRPRY